MSSPYVINVSSDEEDEDDVQVLAFHQATQELIDQAPPKIVKKLSEAECPICFDTITNATTTSCGHVYCLDCLQKSISASLARGQTRGKKGVGLCPMCRKTVAFKETVVLRLRKGPKVAPPDTKRKLSVDAVNSKTSVDATRTSSRLVSSDDEFKSFDNSGMTNIDRDASPEIDEELLSLFVEEN